MSEAETAPEKGTEGYNEQMVAKFEEGFSNETTDQKFDSPTVEIEAMPEGGSEKFYNADTGEYDWKNHSVELQYKIDQKAEPKKEEDTNETNETASPVNWDNITSDIDSTNTISADNYQQLKDFGIPEAVLDGYIGLLENNKNYMESVTADYAGGQENLATIFEWASTNLSEEEIANYNSILETPNWRMAIDSLRVSADVGLPPASSASAGPQLVEGQNLADSGLGFPSKQQMVEAMSDPRYKKDPAFRNQVRLRVGNSSF